MANQDRQDLSYGHLGNSIYDSASASWIFQRDVGNDVEYYRVEEPRVLVPPQISRNGSSDFGSDEAPARRRERQTKALVRLYPELEPAIDLLPDLARVSEAIEQVAASHDPNQGSLLAFGRIPDEATKASAQVVAFATGPSGSDIRLIEVQKLDRGWDDSKLAYLKVPTANGESASWQGTGVPIQQIVFAQPIERGETFLLVRSLTSTLIFRPRLRGFSGRGNSRLDFNYLAEIGIDITGGALHSAVSFNPWNTRQLAVIDSAGHWSVWELQGRHDTSLTLMYDGECQDLDDGPASVQSGWWRFLWVANPTNLVIISRSSLRVVELSAKAVPADVDVPLLDTNGLAWNLDMILLPGQPDHLVVLTTANIQIIKVGNSAFGEASAKCVLSIQHFLDPQDISLSLQAVVDSNDILLIVYSGIQSLLDSYRITMSEGMRLSIGDAIGLELPFAFNPGAHGISLDPVGFGGRLDHGDCLVTRLSQSSPRFVNVTVLHKDLALRQILCHARRRDGRRCDKVLPPTWDRRRKAVKSASRWADDSFIVDSDDDATRDLNAASMRERPVSAYAQRRQEQSRSVSTQQWTIDLHLTAAKLNVLDVEQVTSFEEILEAANELLLSNNAEQQGSSLLTLRDLMGGEVTLLDVAEAEHRLGRLDLIGPRPSRVTSSLDDDPADASQLIRLTHAVANQPPGLEVGLPELGMSAIYNTILRCWVAPLQNNVSELTSSAKEQFARRMTAELVLACHNIAPETIAHETQEDSQTLYQPDSPEWELPLRPSNMRSQELPSSSQASLPTPSPTATPSAVTESSNPSTFAAPELTRLRKYTPFTKSTPTALPRSLATILSHWTPGADPTTYDWQRVARTLTQQHDADADADELTQRERAALQRRSERHVRRQRREAQQSQAQDLLSSQVPEIASASSQHPRDWHAQHPLSTAGMPTSSQLSGPTQMAMPASQILPGRHGGRPLGKKKRKLGF